MYTGSNSAYLIRPPQYSDMDTCVRLVRENWGDVSADRCWKQFVEAFQGGEYAPKFFIADHYATDETAGFCALRKTMMMSDFWEFIWVALKENHRGKGLGTLLTEHRLDYVRENDGTSVLLVTQKPTFFNRFGFLTDRDHGNGWMAMSCQLQPAEMK